MNAVQKENLKLVEENHGLKVVAAMQIEPVPIVLDLDRLRFFYLEKDISTKTFVKWWLAVRYGKNAVFSVDAEALAEEMSGPVGNDFLFVKSSDVLKALAELMKKRQVSVNNTIQLALNLVI